MERRFLTLLVSVLIVSFVGPGAYDVVNAEKNIFEKAFDAPSKVTITKPAKRGVYDGPLKLVKPDKKKRRRIKYICKSGKGKYEIIIESIKKIKGFRCRKIRSKVG